MSDNKEKYTRKNIKSTILKLVIIRIDYSGLTNFNVFLENLKNAEFMKNNFKRMRLLSNRSTSRPLKRSSKENGTLPLSQNVLGNVYHFFDCTLDEDTSVASLYVTSECFSLSIDCSKGYRGSEAYTKFMLEIIRTLAHSESYINIERVGIRKIDSVDVPNLISARNIFDEKFVVINDFLSADDLKESTKTNVYLKNEIHFNTVQYVAKKTDDS